MVKFYTATLTQEFSQMDRLSFQLQFLMTLIYPATGRKFSLTLNYLRMFPMAEI